MRTRAQQWSATAYAKIGAQKDGRFPAKYRTSCMKMPSLIHQSGLLQALVFQVARDDAGRQYVDDLAQVVRRKDHQELISAAQQQSLGGYLALSQDVIEAAQWMRKFAQVELDDDAS